MADTDEADYKEYIDDLVSEIGSGYYDKYLRQIVRACVGRRDKIHGTSNLVPDPVVPEDNKEMKALREALTGGTVQSGFVPVTGPVPVTNAFLTSSNRILPVARNVRSGNRPIFTRKGYRFFIDEMVGREFLFPTTYSPKTLHDVRLSIVQVDNRGVRCMMMTRPNSRAGNYFTKWLQDVPVLISWRLMEAYFVQMHY